ncbi:MAG TPA: Spy/CpxP family protein refolding chaperone [Stellaceae bacterium]|nr:Spy/CpxP family protein refolding chaperone [Stellaceae bacterium]
MKLFRTMVAVACLGALAPAVVKAQQAQRNEQTMMGGGQMPMMGGMMMMEMMAHGGMMPMMSSMMMPMMGMADHVEGRLAFLKTELKITDAQLPQWNAFAEALRANATQANGMMKQMPAMMQGGAPSSLPEQLEVIEKHMATHLEMLQRLKTSLLPLYASFSEEQKRSADALFHGPMGM